MRSCRHRKKRGQQCDAEEKPCSTAHSNLVGVDKRWARNRVRLRKRHKKALESVVVCVFVDGLDDDVFSLDVQMGKTVLVQKPYGAEQLRRVSRCGMI